jgi:hypothetical protein
MPDARARLRRLETLAWLLDSSIVLPGGFRVGLDPILGLLPGIGDAIGALVSAYIVNEARALGVPRTILIRMMGNVLLDTLVGSIPVAGDLFDAAFKANMRNMALLQRYHLDPIGSRRTSGWIVAGLSALLALMTLALLAIPVLLIAALIKAF